MGACLDWHAPPPFPRAWIGTRAPLGACQSRHATRRTPGPVGGGLGVEAFDLGESGSALRLAPRFSPLLPGFLGDDVAAAEPLLVILDEGVGAVAVELEHAVVAEVPD